MSNVLHRTTLQYLTLADTPLYPVEDWIINPDLSGVVGVPTKYIKIVGDSVLKMTQPEKDVVDTANLPTLKTQRYAEIDTKTEELIAKGFTYSSSVFSLSANAQITCLGLVERKDSLTYPVDINLLDDSSKVSLADATAMQAFFDAAQAQIRTHLDNGTTLKQSIRDAADTATVNLVVDSR